MHRSQAELLGKSDLLLALIAVALPYLEKSLSSCFLLLPSFFLLPMLVEFEVSKVGHEYDHVIYTLARGHGAVVTLAMSSIDAWRRESRVNKRKR